ncbi:hypothetical protein Lesp02_76750 [Lentzea sp. NBRC 105346]|uniref:DUF4360 domain-containing protein n=1 Tax=Lentzea sp. NBRC 105346 TaxID=3032205 RepID=UPI0024A5AC5A|nr:DUF4360 domain-containing protein [Lentzea sp. NBRC 105346]GLZ35488.1 hypothetical protein Lesp02_76750 [Lentzea sp. NBRC 105346]
MHVLATIAIVLATVVPPGEKVTIDVVTVNGTGCPRGSAVVAVSPDNTAFTLNLEEMVAAAGKLARPGDARRSCTFNLRMRATGGYELGIERAVYRGWGQIERGAVGTARPQHYFQGSPGLPGMPRRFPGPFSDDWEITDDTPREPSCDTPRNLVVTIELGMSAGTSDPKTTSYLGMGSSDGSLPTVYRLLWKRCP